MARLSSLALATILSLGSTKELSQPMPAHAEPITAAAAVLTIGGWLANIATSSNAADAQRAAAKAQAAAVIEAEKIRAAATSELARAQVTSALIQAQSQIRIALENRLAQLQLEVLRNKHNTEQEKLRNRHNTEQKLIDTGLMPLSSFNKRFGQSIQPIFAPASNRSARGSARPGVGGYQLFRY